MSSAPDYRNKAGQWATWGYCDGRQRRTLSGARWNAINKRCLPGGSCQKSKPRYMSCVNVFSGFQDFVEWSRDQVGYAETDEIGLIYQLDKDLLVRGNKEYSPETCLFVPMRVNTFFLISNSKQGEHPPGVSFNKAKGKFVAQCNGQDGKPVHLGCFSSAMEAHSAWKSFKADRCDQLASEFTHSHARLHRALLTWSADIRSTEGVFCP